MNTTSASPVPPANPLKGTTLNHPQFRSASEQLASMILNTSGDGIILLIGPSQSGKTTVASRARAIIAGTLEEEMIANTSMVPYARVTLVAEKGIGFSPKDLYQSALESLGEVLVERKCSPKWQRSGNTTFDRRRALITAVRGHQTRAIFYDEGSQVIRAAKAKDKATNAIFYKNLAAATNCLQVIIGTYDLLEMLGHEPEVDNRVRTIHLRRYGNDEYGVREFKKILVQFSGLLSKQGVGFDSSLHWEYLHQQTFGCVGLLNRWLSSAYETARRTGVNEITGHILVLTRPPSAGNPDYLARIVEGESRTESIFGRAGNWLSDHV